MDRLAAMEAFVQVIETGSFSNAARRLQIGQPALSKTIAQLESHLGVRLLLRSSRGVSPTEAGRGFYERAKRTLEEADEAEAAARGSQAALHGRLRICAAVTFARLHILPRLPLFLARHPALEIDIVLDDRSVDLIGEGIDVALRMGTLSDSAMAARRLGRCRRIVVGTPAYIDAVGQPRRPEDLSRHEVIVYRQRGGGSEWTFVRGDESIVVSVGGRVQVSAAEGLRAGVFAGLGFAVASEWMFWPELEGGQVREILTDWTLPPLDIWAVFPGGRRGGAKAQAFAAFVQSQLPVGHSARE